MARKPLKLPAEAHALYQEQYEAAKKKLAETAKALRRYEKAMESGDAEAVLQALGVTQELEEVWAAIPRMVAADAHYTLQAPWSKVATAAGMSSPPSAANRWGIASENGLTKREQDRLRRLRQKVDDAAASAKRETRWLPTLPGLSSAIAGQQLGVSWQTVRNMSDRGDLLRIAFQDEAGVPLVSRGYSELRYPVDGMTEGQAYAWLAEQGIQQLSPIPSAPKLDARRRRIHGVGGEEQIHFPELAAYELAEVREGTRVYIMPESEVQGRIHCPRES